MSEGCVFCDQSWMRTAEIFIETPHCIFASTRDPDSSNLVRVSLELALNGVAGPGSVRLPGGGSPRRCLAAPVMASTSRPACLLMRCSPGYEPPGLAAVGKAGDGGDFVHVHAGRGTPALRSIRSSEAASAPWSSAPSAMIATSMPLSVWRTWYSATFGALTMTVRIISASTVTDSYRNAS